MIEQLSSKQSFNCNTSDSCITYLSDVYKDTPSSSSTTTATTTAAAAACRSDSSSSSSLSADDAAFVRDLNSCCDSFIDCFGFAPSNMVRQRFRYWLGFCHIERNMICAAIEETALAPRPSFRYTNAIISSCISEDCRTLKDFIKREERHRNGGAF